jgi:hypothetical protein
MADLLERLEELGLQLQERLSESGALDVHVHFVAGNKFQAPARRQVQDHVSEYFPEWL